MNNAVKIYISSIEQVYTDEKIDRILVRYNCYFDDNDFINGTFNLSKEDYEINNTVEKLKVFILEQLKTRFS